MISENFLNKLIAFTPFNFFYYIFCFLYRLVLYHNISKELIVYRNIVFILIGVISDNYSLGKLKRILVLCTFNSSIRNVRRKIGEHVEAIAVSKSYAVNNYLLGEIAGTAEIVVYPACANKCGCTYVIYSDI